MSPSEDVPPPFFTTSCRDMGIDALGRVADQIVTQVQALVSTLLLPGIKYSDLLYNLRATFEQGVAIIGGLSNSFAPIHRMPPELLVKIFALSPRTITHGARREHAHWPFKAEVDAGDLHKLTKVCRHWRDLAIAAPILWTTLGTRRSVKHNPTSDYFWSSKYLPGDSSVDLIIHFNPHSRSSERMVEFILEKAPSIRELHAWDTARIPDVPLFLLSFDASSLEHCMFWTCHKTRFSVAARHDRQPPENRFMRFFSNGGARLRSLCLSDFYGLPTNEFPALTLLVISSYSIEAQSRVDMADLIKFLSGCPQLEEAYIYNIQWLPSSTSPRPSPPVPLPHLKHLSYSYYRRQRPGWGEAIEYLLSHTSIPSTCDMHFAVPEDDSTTNRGILDNACRHVEEKDAVSHLFLWLSPEDASSMQLVFSQGSIRLDFDTGFDYAHVLRSFPRLFSRTEDVRIHYSSTQALGTHTEGLRVETSLSRSLPVTFPNVKVISLIPDGNTWLYPVIHQLHQYLAAPPPRSTTSVTSLSEGDHANVPHPTLDVLWIFVHLDEEIASLNATLAARAALGFPIRCVIVHHCFAAGSTALAQLQALSAEEVILTRSEASDTLREVDWAVKLADRFSLPASIRRDWPTMWYRNSLVDGDRDRDDDSESGESE